MADKPSSRESGFVYEYDGKEYPPSMRGEALPWLGITYPNALCHSLLLSAWRRVACPQGWHLWDEIMSDFGHRVSCDACELSVNISPTPSVDEVMARFSNG